jgi:chromosomal replication initiation ATPase DnaA
MTQLVLDLAHRVARGRGDFLVTGANRTALAALDAWRDWPGGRLCLVGPESAGKSHLAAVWAAAADAAILGALPAPDAGLPAGAAVLEDADRSVPGAAGREAALFHLLNAMAEAGRPLLLTARTPPALWPVRLPDLASRLGAMAVALLDAPDDRLLAALLLKQFADRQLAVSPGLLRFLLRRMDRSAAAAARLAATLDAAALAERRSLTVPFARRILGREGCG